MKYPTQLCFSSVATGAQSQVWIIPLLCFSECLPRFSIELPQAVDQGFAADRGSPPAGLTYERCDPVIAMVRELNCGRPAELFLNALMVRLR
jgi:hypothetical protein